MFDTCTAANRIIDQPLLTTFRFDYTKGYVSSPTEPYGLADGYKYTRVRRASYKYVGCTHAAALAKAKELDLLFNRKVEAFWTRSSYNNGYVRGGIYGWVKAADVKVVLDHDIAYNVEVSLDEELYAYYKADLSSGIKHWTAFESDPDYDVKSFFKFGGSRSSGTDFEYDGII